MSIRAEVAGGRQIGVLTRDDIIKALREYAALYGDDFPQSAFSPASAKRNGRPDLVERYYTPRAGGLRWPSLNAIKSKFASWNDARAAAGFPPNSTGPARGRRRPGEAEPILSVRERLVYVPSQQSRELRERVRRLEERLAAARARADRLEVVNREMRERRAVVSGKPTTKTVVKTKTKTVKVRDERALERARARLADEQASRRAVEDQLRSATRETSALRAEAAEVRSAAVASRAEALRGESELERASDRLAASEARVERLTAELEQARAQLLGTSEAAIAAELVRLAEVRVEQAEVRAARAEREMAEQAAAITGEMRKLTPGELAELRVSGPAGPAVLAAALKKLAVARQRGGKEPLRVALTEVAKAVVTWLDRL